MREYLEQILKQFDFIPNPGMDPEFYQEITDFQIKHFGEIKINEQAMLNYEGMTIDDIDDMDDWG